MEIKAVLWSKRKISQADPAEELVFSIILLNFLGEAGLVSPSRQIWLRQG